LLTLAFALGVTSSTTFADALSSPIDPRGLEELPRAAEDPYAPSYLHFEVTRNYPVAKSQEKFEAGVYHPAFNYLYNLDGRWLMGLGAQYKIFKKKEHGSGESDQLAILALTHEGLFSLRLYHPAYLLVGPKLQYLFPAKKAKFPVQKDPLYETEISGALTIMLSYVIADQSFLTVRIDRWRGTRTTRFQGIESSVGLAYALK
jgi:hypothetical protein